MTIVEMLAKCRREHPDKNALIFNDRVYTFEDLYRQAAAVAKALSGLGLAKGDRVGLLLQKRPEAIIAFLGTVAAGGVVVPLDFTQTPAYLQNLVDVTEPRVLVADQEFLPLVASLRLPDPAPAFIVTGEPPRAGDTAWDDIVEKAGAGDDMDEAVVTGSDVAYFNLTSGSTGAPKCAVCTHDNIYWNTRSFVETRNLVHDDVHLCMFPVFLHPHELFARPLYLGGTIVLTDRISPKALVRAINDNGVTAMMAIAFVYETLLRHRETSEFALDSLRLPESGGMHVNPALAEKFARRFGVPLVPVWGSTEATGVALAPPLGEATPPGSMGRPCAYYEAKVVDESGKDRPTDRVGELIIKGPAVCGEYFRNPVETARHMRDGWFFTQDMARIDSDGYFHFAGRQAGMMKVGGLKVYPVEIEDVLSLHPAVAEVAVVRDESDLHGEVPKAVIVLKPGTQADKKDIRKFCEQRLPRHKVPRVVEFLDALPRTPGGKILTRDL